MVAKSNIFILPWNSRSRAAHAIRKAMGVKIIHPTRSPYEPDAKHTVINYGSSKSNLEFAGRVINHPKAIAKASNKRGFFETIAKSKTPCRIPQFTTDAKEALKWAAKGEVVGRHVLEGHSGTGIVFSSDGINADFLSCKLWVKYIKKQEEYRVHIAFGQVIDVQRKVLRKTDDVGEAIDPKTIDFRVRSFKNGFVFIREGISPNVDVITQATLAMGCTTLDFGAVDVIWNEHEGKAYVLEINTAPGLEGQTIESYAEAFKKELGLNG